MTSPAKCSLPPLPLHSPPPTPSLLSTISGLSQSGEDNLHWAAVPYFVSYVMLSSFLVLKMMIAIILENLEIALSSDSAALQIEHADAFLAAWAEFDPEGEGTMLVSHLARLIRSLPPPLGLDPAHFRNRMILPSHIARYVYQMDLRSHRQPSGQPVVRFHELLACLAKDAYEHKGEEGAGGYPLAESEDPSRLVKTSKSWGDVLPPWESKLGQQLYQQLESLGIYRAEEANEEEGYWGETIGVSIIVSSWTSKLRELVRRRAESTAAAEGSFSDLDSSGTKSGGRHERY